MAGAGDAFGAEAGVIGAFGGVAGPLLGTLNRGGVTNGGGVNRCMLGFSGG